MFAVQSDKSQRNPVRCKQFVYTYAEIDGGRGYQVVAQSPNLNLQQAESLREYLLPAGIRQSIQFDRSRQLLVLENEVAASIIANIGFGEDNRPRTLYNHTIIISKEDFANLGYDPAVFDGEPPFIVEGNVSGRKLPDEVFLATRPEFQSSFFREAAISKELLSRTLGCLLASFSGANRTLILVGQSFLEKTSDNLPKTESLIRNLFSCLPAKVRLLPYTTITFDAGLQPRFKVMVAPATAAGSLGNTESIAIVDLPNDRAPEYPEYAAIASALAQAAWEGDVNTMHRIHKAAELLPLDRNPKEALTYLSELTGLAKLTDVGEMSTCHLRAAMAARDFSGELASGQFREARERSLESNDVDAIVRAYLTSGENDKTFAAMDVSQTIAELQKALHRILTLNPVKAIDFLGRFSMMSPRVRPALAETLVASVVGGPQGEIPKEVAVKALAGEALLSETVKLFADSYDAGQLTRITIALEKMDSGGLAVKLIGNILSKLSGPNYTTYLTSLVNNEEATAMSVESKLAVGGSVLRYLADEAPRVAQRHTTTERSFLGERRRRDKKRYLQEVLNAGTGWIFPTVLFLFPNEGESKSLDSLRGEIIQAFQKLLLGKTRG